MLNNATNVAEFINASICLEGELIEKTFYIDQTNGLIIDKPDEGIEIAQTYDVQGHVIAPAYLELQTNGCAGFHFTRFKDSADYQNNLRRVARYLLTTGVGSFWATVPTVSASVFKNVLSELSPKVFGYGADLLGAHCEGPWLNPAKKGAHDSSLMQWPSKSTVEDIYGEWNLPTVKMVTMAPELPEAMGLIGRLSWGTIGHPIVVSFGHSSADYSTGAFALTVGGKALTHVFNAMTSLNHRQPGLAGTISSKHAPYYSLIADGIHLHPATVSMAFRANPKRCMLITDSIELAGMPDGIYPGHAQIPFQQQKEGNKVTIKGTDTLIGSCIAIDECVRNLIKFSDCTLAQAVRCATENIASLMKLNDRGFLQPGKRADFIIMDRRANVKEVWLKGQCVCNRHQPPSNASSSDPSPQQQTPSADSPASLSADPSGDTPMTIPGPATYPWKA